MRIDRLKEIQNIRAELASNVNGIVCVVALLVTLLEERGSLERGEMLSALTSALQLMKDEPCTPESRVLQAFVEILAEKESQVWLV